MTRRAAVAALVLGLLAACGGGDDGGSEPVTVADAWARPTPAGVSVGGVYLEVEAADEDALVGATVESAVAAAAELHVTMTTGGAGQVTMHPVVEIALPAGQPVELEPGGSHVMLIGLPDPLEVGETFELTLRFADAAEQVVTVEVRDEAP